MKTSNEKTKIFKTRPFQSFGHSAQYYTAISQPFLQLQKVKQTKPQNSTILSQGNKRNNTVPHWKPTEQQSWWISSAAAHACPAGCRAGSPWPPRAGPHYISGAEGWGSPCAPYFPACWTWSRSALAERNMLTFSPSQIHEKFNHFMSHFKRSLPYP